jgi:hypothetical protein
MIRKFTLPGVVAVTGLLLLVQSELVFLNDPTNSHHPPMILVNAPQAFYTVELWLERLGLALIVVAVILTIKRKSTV